MSSRIGNWAPICTTDSLGSENRFYLYATNLHPNALGYEAMAHLIHNAMTGGSMPPFVAGGLCLRLTEGGSCVNPLPQRKPDGSGRSVLCGSDLYNQQSDPCRTGTRTLDHDRQSGQERIEQRLPVIRHSLALDPYVAYDANATTLPSWLSSGFIDSGMRIYTSNASAPGNEALSPG